MAQFPRYESYKDSGVEWLGEIPSHWKLTTGRTCLNEQSNKNIGLREKTVLSLSYGKIVIKPEEKLHGLVPESFETYQIVKPGNIIIRSTDLQNDKTSLRVGLVEDKGIITSAYLCLNIHRELSSKFAYYLLHSYDILKVFYGMGSGLRQNLSFIDFKYLPLTFPSLEEQQKIVEFLERKIAEIDEAIAKKQKLIELLQEQKAILINRSVTKGLNPNVKMRDSGIDWIGEIPEHWKLLQIRRSLKHLEQGSSPAIINIDEQDRENFYVLKISAIKNGVFIEDEKKPISYKSFVNQHQINKGDLLLTRGNTPELVADTCYVTQESEKNVMMSDLIYRLTFNQEIILHEYANYFFQSNIAKHQIRLCARGSSQSMVKVSQEHIRSWLILAPPINEQLNIIKFILEIYLHFKNTISTIEKEIKKIDEFKQILISNAVTGKIQI